MDAGEAQASFLYLILFYATIVLVFLFIWLWALIDVIKRNFTNPTDKKLWLILIIIGLFITIPIIPILYLIIGRKKGVIQQN